MQEQKAQPAKAAKATKVAKVPAKVGVVLKQAFKDKDAEQLKTLRRRMRAAIRAGSPEGKVLAAHKIGTRWIISPAMRKAAVTVETALQ